MPLEYRDDGILVGDTGILAAITGRPPYAIRVLCERGPDGYDADQCTNRLLENPDPMVYTAYEAQRFLDIKAGTIRQWVARNKLRAVGHNPDGHALYNPEHLKRLRARSEAWKEQRRDTPRTRPG